MVFVLACSLLGLVGIQQYWIRSAVLLRKERFHQKVSSVLQKVVEELERQEALLTISSDLKEKVKKQQLLLKQENGKFRFDYNLVEDTTLSGELAEATSILKNESMYIEDSTKRSNYEILIRSNTYPLSFSELKSKKNELSPQQLRDIELNKVITKVDFIEDILNKLLNGAKPIESRISPKTMQSVIRNSLYNQGMFIPFKFALKTQVGYLLPDSSLESYQVYKKSAYFEKSPFKILLYPDDIYSQNSYLIISFPGEKAYVLQSMWRFLLPTGVFILLIIFCFYVIIQTIFQQKRLSDMKTDFINNMTHELKTPISTISLATEVLKDASVSHRKENYDRFLNVIQEENNRLHDQVQKVLQIAKMDKGEFKTNKTQINLHRMIEKVSENINLQVEARGGSIELHLNAEDPIIEADEMHIKNVITNLLDNANKYSLEKPKIILNTWNKNGGIYLNVIDHGIGMNKATQKRIFEKFYRVPTGNIHDVKGFGLGLSYVKTVVNAHRGQINVDSDLGKGSKFEVYLPKHT